MTNRYSIDEYVAEGLLRLLGHASMSMSRHHEWPEEEAEPGEEGPATQRLVARLRRATRADAKVTAEPEEDRPAPVVEARPSRRRETARPEPRRATEEEPSAGRSDKGGFPRLHPWRRALTASDEAKDEVCQATHWLRDALRR